MKNSMAMRIANLTIQALTVAIIGQMKIQITNNINLLHQTKESIHFSILLARNPFSFGMENLDFFNKRIFH